MGNPLFSMIFPDGTTFTLPEEWEDIFVARFGEKKEGYKELFERITFITSKYIENKAFPSKFDGLKWLAEDKEIDDVAFDDPMFYGELWEEWGDKGQEWNRSLGSIPNPPSWADVAEGLIYQELRSALLQKALKMMGANTKVATPEQFLEDIDKLE